MPALVLLELLSVGYAVSLGGPYLRAKTRSYIAILHMLPGVWNGRRDLRSLRRIDDRDLLARLSSALPVNQLVGEGKAPRGAVKIVNAGLDCYFRLLKRIVRW
jgi:hypothetical protein